MKTTLFDLGAPLTHEIPSYLDANSLQQLRRTSRFFNQSKTILEKLHDRIPRDKVLWGNARSNIIITPHNVWLTPEYFNSFPDRPFFKWPHRFKKLPLDLNHNETIIKVVGSQFHQMILTSHHRLLGLGFNSFSKMGIPYFIQQQLNIPTPIPLPFLPDEHITQIESTARCSFIITNQNRLYATGSNHDGQLGLNTGIREVHGFIPIELPLRPHEKILKIASSAYHTLLLTNKNTIYVTGDNEFGQLGLDELQHYHQFTKLNIANDVTIIDIAVTLLGTLILTKEHGLHVAGANQCGELGIKKNPKIYQFTPCPLPLLNDKETVNEMITGLHSTLLLTNKKRLLVCGAASEIGLKQLKNQYEFIECKPNLRMNEKILKVFGNNGATSLLTSHYRLLYVDANNQFTHSHEQQLYEKKHQKIIAIILLSIFSPILYVDFDLALPIVISHLLLFRSLFLEDHIEKVSAEIGLEL